MDIVKEFEEIGVSKEGIAYMKDKFQFKVLKFSNIPSRYCNMMKQDMLSIGGEVAVNKGCIDCSVETSDVLIGGTVRQLRKFSKKMMMQPDVCKELGKKIIDSIDD